MSVNSSRKLIVLIDDYLFQNEVVQTILVERGFEVAAFTSFKDAAEFLSTHTPELIISDLVGHENINGVEFYINEIMKRKVNFALWTGVLDIKNGNVEKDMGLFLEGLPKDYKVSFDPKQALSQGEVDLIIQDFKNNTTSTFPVFEKPGNLGDIIKHFNLNINGFVVLYMGTLVEAVRMAGKL